MASILYFSTTTCGPCKMFKPVVQQVSAETGKQVQYIDAQQNSELAAKYGVSSVPTIVIEAGHDVVKLIGAQPKAKLIDLFNKC